ncbi:MAG: DUF2092 domain-containing protein [Planctomycetes bacterium]|nr:DUF2092 domain-containing protein [Planctomycetota bacterium]
MIIRLVAVLLAATASFSGSSGETPQQLLERMKDVYADCKTYRDSGVTQTVFFSDRGPRTVRKPFTTAFVRPRRFRYEFRDRRGEYEFDRYLIACDGPDVRVWWDVRPGVNTDRSPEAALSAAAGVSSGSSYKIPPLLMPDAPWTPLRGNPLVGLRNLKRLENGEIGGQACLRIAGDRDGDPITLWIEEERMLLRRIEEQCQSTDYRTEETTDFQPEIDVVIPDELLRFDPPESAREPSVASVPPRSREAEPTPEQILEAMKDVYARCRTYMDTGEVHEVFVDDSRRRTIRKPFTTAFVRPDRFRYEFRDRAGEEEWNRYLAWKEATEIRSWRDIKPGIEVHDSLRMALSGAGVLSGGSASVVPSLLMPVELGMLAQLALEELERLEDGERNGVACYRILGKQRDAPILLWIEKERFLLRRSERQSQIPGYLVETTTDYLPELDAEVPAEVLLFDPPERR